jgi:hypothetical protein
MIVAIERNKFIYLYKYNEISIDANQVIDMPIEKITKSLKQNNPKLITDFNRILPIFEQDHEVILLEINKDDILVEGKLIIFFKAILSIYPLTKIGSQLLQGKLNENFIIKEPIFDPIIKEVKIIRTLENRKLAANNILDHFSLRIENDKINVLDQVLKRIILNKYSTNDSNSYLDNLISYNKTPSNIPDGNVEFFCKIGVIVYNYIKADEAKFFKGGFYKSCLKHREDINTGNIFNSYSTFIDIKDNELISSLAILKSRINIDITDIDIFKVSYFFLAYKTFLNKNDKNIVLLVNEIEQLIFDDEQTAAFVLAMIGYAFSFELLYESIHALNKTSLIKEVINKPSKTKPLPILANTPTKVKEPFIAKPIKSVDPDSSIEMVSEEISVPIVIFESNINNDKTGKSDLTLFGTEDKSTNETNFIVDNEITKTLLELKDWINNHKAASKSAQTQWKKFIDHSLKYGSHSLSDILIKVKSEKLETKLTNKMIKDLEMFFA